MSTVRNVSAAGSEYSGKQIDALIKIQRAWRRYIDTQVFRFYRDLINFHNNGDPIFLMKTINPIEAKYVDSAAGIRLRFRLAGERFPPTIYYKVFTNRPIQDLCSNAPRDYTKPYLRLKSATDSNNNVNRFPLEDTEGWYKRIENNGWRPVSYKHLLQSNAENYYCSHEYQQKQTFAHTKLLRRQDVERRRKRKKLQWLQKMYSAGVLNTHMSKDGVEDGEMTRLINETTTSILKVFNSYGSEAVEDWEVDELLEWTHNLNFDDYLLDWRTLGTSGSSNVIFGNVYSNYFFIHFIVYLIIFLANNYHTYERDVDERTNSSLTESRHVSIQATVPTIGSVRVPLEEPSFERTTTTALSQPNSEYRNLLTY
ncbi:unnamed protein product [Didymodactylos carnosus]|uniref:Uncharacterized protein n=1 Tax=Didymodactylos carnosus TaxID=1234261 RepID=A0A8S2EJH8_9BILA|nr:unnamed protein product [Didymodactylos carnosus]CAF4002102.1 unnamed protein product [Didymodactylos carnosus]